MIIMKRVSFSLLLILTFFVFGCSKDDGAGEVFEYNQGNLLGRYALQSLKSTEVITERVRGFEVTTTTVSTGDTFDVKFTFEEDGFATANGTYRVTQRVTQNNQTTDTAFIVVLNQEKLEYIVKSSLSQLELGGIKYEVKDFSPRGFKLHHQEREQDGDVKTETTIDAEFKR